MDEEREAELLSRLARAEAGLAEMEALTGLHEELLKRLFAAICKGKADLFAEFMEVLREDLAQRRRPLNAVSEDVQREHIVRISVHLDRFEKAMLRRL